MLSPNKLMKRKIVIISCLIVIVFFILLTRVLYIQMFNSDFLQTKAYEQQTRDRLIKPVRGNILDRTLVPIATTETVASVSVINAQIKNLEEVSKVLSEKLDLEYENVFSKVAKKVALNRIKAKVDKLTADDIRKLNLLEIVIERSMINLIQNCV